MPLKTKTPGLGLMKGLGITLKTMLTPASTQQYPHERPVLAPRTRGVIALMDENCTVCMLCSRECPDWCIYIDSHKETVPPAKEGGRARTRNVLDRFAIDFALCMYCGICIEVCPFDALFWSPEFEYAEYSIDGLLHEMDRLRDWMDTVPAPPPLEEGAEQPPEVTSALEKAASARQAAVEADAAKETEAAAASAAVAAPAADKAPEVHVDDAGEIDQETFDQLIAEGKSERIARAKAKAAYVRKRKKELAAEQANAGGDAPAAEAPAAAEPESTDAPAAETPPADADAPPDKPRAADIHVEGGEIDQETYDQLIAEGKSERIARAKAKAAWVRKRKQEIIDSGAEGASAAADDSGAEGEQ